MLLNWGMISMYNAWVMNCFQSMIYAAEHWLCSLRWRHNGRDRVSNHQPHDCLLNCLFRRRSKKISKLHVTGLCAGNSPGTGEFPAQMASNAENVSIWWRHHAKFVMYIATYWAKERVMKTSWHGSAFHITGFVKRIQLRRIPLTNGQ